MALKTKPQLVQPVAAPQHYVPPTARELRAQAVHRLQAGLLGLAAMLLLVALANIINDRVRRAEGGAPSAPSAQSTGNPGASDPLADIGVLPAADPGTDAPAAQARPKR